ncbi:MAG: protein-disulfide reductase DsbD [Steroidobacteraceae bacterium]|nr:protein-disulfide reductase DsbD [Steroidobacteraceae bacterium]
MRARNLLPSVLGLFALLAGGQALSLGEDEYLLPEDAFKYTATADEQNVTIEWRATKGYYLYKKRMGLSAATPGVTVGDSVYPKSEMHKDEYFGEQEIFRGTFKVTAPLSGAKVGDTVALKLKWQGCADAGLCYPPSVWDASVKVLAAAAPLVADDEEYLDVEKAFVLTYQALSTNTMQLNWRIADGYYLYKQRIKVEPAGDTKTIGALVLPKGESHSDEYFGEQEIYRQSVDATFSVPPSDAKSVNVNVTYQGCADAGLCYPPQTTLISISLEDAPPASAATPAAGEFVSEQDSYAEKIKHGNIFLVLLSFFGAGLLLAFTPCVLPMVPILSGIIAGSGENVTTRRSFMLSLAYVLGMAFTYTAAGIAAGAIGQGFNLQATFNQPWIVALFSLLFVVLAASMLGLFTIEMPGFIQTRLSNTSNQQQAGTYLGVGVMGSLSALIVSACVAPPLIAALTVISQTGDVVRGGAALFVMSIGMGTPLLLVGASAGKLLPRAGAWMDTVKNLFGVLFLGVAAWMLARIVPGWLSMIIWAVPALVLAWVLWNARAKSAPGRNLSRGLAIIAGFYGVVLLVGAGLGSTNPLAPIPQFAKKQTHLEFKRFKTVADLEREIAAAKAAGRAVMVDFYADWCVSCIEMEHKTFTQPEVHAALTNVVLLQADVTKNDDEDKALYVYFGIIGPPTIAFYGADGTERRNFRVVGFMEAAEFAAVVRQAVAPANIPAQ